MTAEPFLACGFFENCNFSREYSQNRILSDRSSKICYVLRKSLYKILGGVTGTLA